MSGRLKPYSTYIPLHLYNVICIIAIVGNKITYRRRHNQRTCWQLLRWLRLWQFFSSVHWNQRSQGIESESSTSTTIVPGGKLMYPALINSIITFGLNPAIAGITASVTGRGRARLRRYQEKDPGMRTTHEGVRLNHMQPA